MVTRRQLATALATVTGEPVETCLDAIQEWMDTDCVAVTYHPDVAPVLRGILAALDDTDKILDIGG